MVRVMKSCIQSSLKLMNSIIAILGIVMILYSLCMIKVWQKDAEGSSVDHHNSTFPWFIHAFLGIGISLCASTCLGHFAADTANAYYLSCYMLIIFSLLLIETAIVSDVFINSDWDKDLPDDPSGRFDNFKDFVKSNIDVCVWIGLLILVAQGFSILFALVLRTIQEDEVTSHEFTPSRLPLLQHPV
ncbi:tetraspanin-19-like [Cornus florida]|uniref:tetraspanin-19-like n=1 Tax=Cornus florida TaxID=4283 RepID=UPI002896864E|nr:tetraspanin-19-like [Cornus florida]